MLPIKIPKTEFFDESTQSFVYVKEQVLMLEHSLLSISKWESKWHKPFLGTNNKTSEETLDYIKCMTVTPNVDERVYACLTQENIESISAYINDPHTATTFYEEAKEGGSSNKTRPTTAELIYYWMVACNIPSEYQKWHLNNLLTLIRIYNEENQPKDKKKRKNPSDVVRRNHALNQARRKACHSNG